MEKNLQLYEQLRKVPASALKTISGGRLNGMSDVNPMWRIKVMTETFGPCGIGWKYEIVKQWQETYGNEAKAYVNIDLYIKVNGEWSDAIPGTGGSTLVEAKGFVNDEGYKMALTDALSVAMKALGVAADVYFAKDANYGTKYSQPQQQSKPQPKPLAKVKLEDAKVSIEEQIKKAESNKELLEIYNSADVFIREQIKDLLTQRKNELKKK